MNRNTNSYFSTLPSVDIKRTRMPRHSSVKTSWNVGDVIPFYCDEVLPGDTFEVRTSKVIRLQTLITPMMDNLYCDFYYFFVPNRLVWEHWQEFNGENSQSAWVPTVEYEVPQITSPDDGWNVGTLADYFGIPTGIPNLSVNAMPFRAYGLIINDWFRDQNLQDPVDVPVNDVTTEGVNTGNYVTDLVKGGLPFRASKYRDYFTSCLPAPQKGPDVTIPVADAGNYPIYALNDLVPFDGQVTWNGNTAGIKVPMMMYQTSNNPANDQLYGYYLQRGTSYGGAVTSSSLDITNPVDAAATYGVTPANLWAVADGNAAAATINQLRMAFQIQRLYEKDARGGSRYIEILRSHFGVTSPDARLQRPEYLGGNRLPIHINQVLQQSATVEGSTPQGTPTGQSLTSDNHFDFKKSFVEHGFVIGLAVVRYDHTYQQGIERFWSRKSRFDYYWPALAHIGEQAVLNKEIYAQGSSVHDEDGNVIDEKVFGYQEAWADYRYKPNRVTSEMRSQYQQSLDVWHLADDYSELPGLSAEWIEEDPNNVNRVLAVTSDLANQVFADIYVQNWATRPMPMYSVPGLIDHF